MPAVCLRDVRRQARRRRLLLMAGCIWFLYIRRDHRAMRSCWTRQWLLRRDELGAYSTLLSELREEDQGSFLNFLRLSPGLFDTLLEKVTPYIERQNTTFRKAIAPGMRLAITLRYLATGETFKSLSYLFRVGNNTIGTIIPETCSAIHDVLKEEYFQCPTTPEEWLQVAKDYWNLWNFPNCLGSIDGKHVVIRKPACSGSKFFNYKHCFSVILLAMCDANYRFLFVDIGSQGRCSDAGVYAECDLKDALERNTIGVPQARTLPGRDQDPVFPFCLVGDDAFPLKDHIMKPYPHRNLSVPQHIFNYRLSRARRCIENSFGIMSSRFRVLLSPICLGPDKVDAVIWACCSLHNMLRTLSPTTYVLQGEDHYNPNACRNAAQQIPQARVTSRRSASQSAKKYRDYLCDYFSSPEGSVTWQQNVISIDN